MTLQHRLQLPQMRFAFILLAVSRLPDREKSWWFVGAIATIARITYVDAFVAQEYFFLTVYADGIAVDDLPSAMVTDSFHVHPAAVMCGRSGRLVRGTSRRA